MLQETTREVWSRGWLERLAQDVKFALRIFAKTPLVTAAALLSLALGIGANTAIFTLIEAVMLRELPVQDPERLVQVTRDAPGSAQRGSAFTNPIWEELRAQQDVLSRVAAWSEGQFDLSTGGESHLVNSLYVSGDYFGALGVRPATGRLIASSDDQRSCGGVAVLGYGFWQEHYAGSEDVVGKIIRLSGHSFPIVGVAQQNFFGTVVGHSFDIAVPICAEGIMHGRTSMLSDRAAWWLNIIGRLKPGINAQQAGTRLGVLAPQIYSAVVPADITAAGQQRFREYSFGTIPAANGISSLRKQYSRPLAVLMLIVALVLLIACANIASLMSARAASRRKEIAVRLSLGASRMRLVRQLLTECILLSAAGAMLGLLFARIGTTLIVRWLSTTRSTVFLDLGLHAGILGFTSAVATITGLLFGVWPAFRSTKVSLTASMRGSEFAELERHARFRGGRWIVAFQIASSLVLLVGASLFVGSFTNLARLDLGFDRSNVLLAYLSFDTQDAVKQQALVEQVLERVRAFPGVQSASTSWISPLRGGGWDNYIYADDGPQFSGDDADVYMNDISPEYFQTLRSPILAGRDFDARDTPLSPRVAIVNLSLARHFFSEDYPIGRRFRADLGTRGKSLPIEIVGVVRDAPYENLRGTFPRTAYFPTGQMAGNRTAPNLEIRTASRPEALAQSVQEIARGVDPTIHLRLQTLEQQVNDNMTQERLLAVLSGFFGVLALLLAMIGLYGVMAFFVTRQQREIGIRIALGAARGTILRSVLNDVGIMLAIGLPVGLAISAAASRLVQRLLFGMPPHDWATFAVAAAALAAVALLAGYFPAWRAARIDPIQVLREE